MQVDLKRFHAAFFDEAAEHLGTLEEALLVLEREPDDEDLLNRIFRAAHSIKGASGTFGFTDIATLTHGMEGLLDRMRDRQIQANASLVELLLHSADALGALLSAAKDGRPLPTEIDVLVAALEQAKGDAGRPLPGPVTAARVGNQQVLPTGTAKYRIRFAPQPDIFRHGMDPLLLLRELAEMGEIDVVADVSDIPQLAELAPDECYLRWTVLLTTDKSRDEIQSVFVFVAESSSTIIESLPPEKQESQTVENAQPSAACHDMLPAGAPQAAARHENRPMGDATAAGAGVAAGRTRTVESSSIRVSVSKVDALINLVGELVISQSMVNQAAQRMPGEFLSWMQEALGVMNRCTRDLQEQVMSVRMVPLATVFRRFPRVIHDLAATLGKEIALDIVGEDTELDKQMVEQLVDPLTHLMRNAVDHGIETPADRTAAGKPAKGRIAIRAYQEGGNVLIEVSDDGRGLSIDRIRLKAIGLDLIAADAALSDDQARDLVFAPGFSTAESVNDVSGRGVGLDVVKRNIEALNGSVSIQSSAGAGTTFRIRLPLTMAIMDGMAASLGGDIYILPLLSIVESLRPKPTEIKIVAGHGELVMVRGKPVPLVRLHRLFHAPANMTDPAQGLIIIVEHQGKRLGLLVDELLGEMQVVIKSLETNYHKVQGISAATILGDGQVAFILDVAGLARLAKQ